MSLTDIQIVRRHVDALFEELLSTRSGGETSTEPVSAGVSDPGEAVEGLPSEDLTAAASASEWRFVEERDGITYSWPEGTEEYTNFRVFECTSAPLFQYAIGEVETAEREYWGQRRPYFVVFKLGAGGGSKQPIAVFVAVDDFAQSGEYVAVIRGAGGARGQRMFSPDEPLPKAYTSLPVVTFRDRIAGTQRFRGFNRLAVVAHEQDAVTMLRHAAIQVTLRHL